MKDPRQHFGCFDWVVVICGLLVLAGVVLWLVLQVTGNAPVLFEDGSWALGEWPYRVHGCLPWALCAR